MEEMNNTETPQPQTANTGTSMDAFGAPTNDVQEGSDNSNLSVEDAFFSKADVDTQTAPQEGQPVEGQGNTQVEQPYEAKNDDKRYEYWQSQAAKKDNELGQIKGKINAALQAQKQQQRQAPQAPQSQEFPPPPPKPEKPRGFSREEAWSDSSSESAKYLDDVDTWNEQTNNYRDLRSQYEIAVVKENMEAEHNARRQDDIKRAQYNQAQQEKHDIYEHVQGHYGLNQNDAVEFIETMSDPGSISMDNLVQLYRMQKGGGAQTTTQTGPSEAFQQSRNAQQVPSPMGVMPAQSPNSQRSDSDSIMDDLINTHKSKNPWT